MTYQTVRTAAAAVSAQVEAYLVGLERDWPIGTRVRHVGSGWLGTVTGDTSGQAPGITAGPAPAHGVLFAPLYCGRDVPAVVCVAWDHRAAAPVAWMRAGLLQHLSGPTNGGAYDHARGDAGEGVRRRRIRARRPGGGL